MLAGSTEQLRSSLLTQYVDQLCFDVIVGLKFALLFDCLLLTRIAVGCGAIDDRCCRVVIFVVVVVVVAGAV